MTVQRIPKRGIYFRLLEQKYRAWLRNFCHTVRPNDERQILLQLAAAPAGN